ncbi:hypothetical protein DYBT9275_02900 [Dyadobacter sp. CECT 9275]|uniref:Aminoglycoside phosphotransferase domain-containing protein n=1 Tax=Dyadobacter helix TaxID=2822344 RepID=A0A916N697_9BACT|nr:phosphotransferase [Dyadobacter sp. CECT 9275]CAG5002476.1 hypothetical protein DYBT9275_02900 [Dyadobacter sp. CECT 9275]
MFSYAAGKVVRVLNENQLLNLGKEMARFHHVSSNMPEVGARWNFNFETTIDNPLRMIGGSFRDDPEGYNWLSEKARIAKDQLLLMDTADFSAGYCHFDFLPKNFHFENDRITLFDFDFMGYGWLVNDIMTFWQYLVLEVYTGRMTQPAADEAYTIFLEGYRNHRSISEVELAAVPYLSFGFWLFYMGFHTTHDQFTLYTQAPHVKSYLGILKHIVKSFWTKDVEI